MHIYMALFKYHIVGYFHRKLFSQFHQNLFELDIEKFTTVAMALSVCVNITISNYYTMVMYPRGDLFSVYQWIEVIQGYLDSFSNCIQLEKWQKDLH